MASGIKYNFIKYYGGKSRFANLISDIANNSVPTHKIFVDVFGGVALLFSKKSPPSELEVYNDIYPPFSVFFKTIKNKEFLKELQNRLIETVDRYTEWHELREMNCFLSRRNVLTFVLEKIKMKFKIGLLALEVKNGKIIKK